MQASRIICRLRKLASKYSKVSGNGEVWPFPLVLETREHWFESSFPDQFMLTFLLTFVIALADAWTFALMVLVATLMSMLTFGLFLFWAWWSGRDETKWLNEIEAARFEGNQKLSRSISTPGGIEVTNGDIHCSTSK